MEITEWKAYFKRGTSSFEGQLTIQSSKAGIVISKPIDRVRVRSGGASYYNKEWIRGHSPIPRGEFKLWLAPNNKAQHAGAKGVGEFYPISTDNSRYWIHENELGPMPVGQEPRQRAEIGLHDENLIPGSAGCIVVINEDEFWQISRLLQKIGEDRAYLPLKVF